MHAAYIIHIAARLVASGFFRQAGPTFGVVGAAESTRIVGAAGAAGAAVDVAAGDDSEANFFAEDCSSVAVATVLTGGSSP